MNNLNEADILEHLARSMDLNEVFAPPTMGVEGNFAFADARLSVFRSSDYWVTAFELVQHYDLYFSTCFYLFGNCLRDEPVPSQYIRPCVASLEGETVISEIDGWWAVDRSKFSLRFKGEALHFSPTLDEYLAAGIEFDNDQLGPGSLKPIQLLRFLCHRLNHPFFASNDYLRFLMDMLRLNHNQYLSSQMTLLLQTNEWQHPDIINGEDARGLPYFQALSRAISTSDLTELNQVNPALFNTHWKNW